MHLDIKSTPSIYLILTITHIIYLAWAERELDNEDREAERREQMARVDQAMPPQIYSILFVGPCHRRGGGAGSII